MPSEGFLESIALGAHHMEDEQPESLESAASLYLSALSRSDAGSRMIELGKFVNWYGSDTELAALTPFKVGTYSENLDAATTNVDAKIGPVKDFFRYAKKKEWTDINYAVHLKARGGRRRDRSGMQALRASRIQLTAEGHDKIQAELNVLYEERPGLSEAMRVAAADKDFRENAPYQEAREQKARAESRIKELEAVIASADILEIDGVTRDKCVLGTSVTVEDVAHGGEFRYTLVSAAEVDLKKGRISIESPTGKALLNRRKDEIVDVRAPAGIVQYKIVNIDL